MAQNLDVVPTATGAFSRTFENLGLIVQLGVAPFGALFIWLVLLSFVGGIFAAFLGQLGIGVATAMLAAPLFRYYLLKETPKTDTFSLNFGDRERNLTIVFVGYAIAGLIPGWIALYVSSILGFLLSLALIFAFIRLALLPALTALDNPIDLGKAFEKTEGNFWRILLAGLLVGIVMAVIFAILGAIGLVGSFVDGGLASNPVQALFAAIVQLFVASVSIGFISGVYEALVPGTENTTAAINPPEAPPGNTPPPSGSSDS